MTATPDADDPADPADPAGPADLRHRRTERLRLDAVTEADLDALFSIHADPRLWTHRPQARHTAREQTATLVAQSIQDWANHGLGYWVVRGPAGDQLLGLGGCAVRSGPVWNLYYRLVPEAHGRGYAAEMVAAAIESARRLRPELPVVASLLAHNHPSKAVAESAGLRERWSGPDPDAPPGSTDVRLVYADQALTDDQLQPITG